jgi:hypothetical protein
LGRWEGRKKREDRKNLEIVLLNFSTLPHFNPSFFNPLVAKAKKIKKNQI